jgi:cytochrome P450
VREPDFDPLDEAFIRDPHPVFADLRQRCPLSRTEQLGGFWMLTRYDDVVRVTTDTRTFVSGVQNSIPKLPDTGRRGPLHFDPPEHTAYRRALNPAFSEERVARIEPALRRIVAGLVDPLVDNGRGDAVKALADRLPVLALGALMNIPNGVADVMREATEAFIQSVHDADPEATKRESYRIYDLARDLIADRRATPLDPDQDALSALLTIELGGEPITDEMAVGTVRQIVVAAHVGPARALGSVLRRLAEDAELQELLREDPGRIPEALEELLRLYAPNTGFSRTPTEPVEFHGRRVEVDEPIAVNYAAANRDPEVFADPDAFVLGRRPNRHLAFGHGVHKCLGVHLARSQLRIALEELLGRTSSLVLDVHPATIPYTQFPEYGPLSLPLRLTPA